MVMMTIVDSILKNESYVLGEVRMTAVLAFSYAISFAAIAAVIVHTILYHGKKIIKQFRSSLKDDATDIHAVLMSRYREAPEWWYVDSHSEFLFRSSSAPRLGTRHCFSFHLVLRLSSVILVN